MHETRTQVEGGNMEQKPKLIIASNRLPITIKKDPATGKSHFTTSPGGLVSGLKELHQAHQGIWIGHCGLYDHDPSFAQLSEELAAQRYHSVPLKKKDYTSYYNGMSNGTIWPLFHYFSESLRFSQPYWDAYQSVNEQFAETILAAAAPNDLVWIHDYQLMLVPRMLREKAPALQIAYFHHIPFPSSEIFRILPGREDILRGLLGADLIGFHTFDYARHFMTSVARTLKSASHVDEIHHDNRRIKVSAFPLGIDVPTYTSIAEKTKSSANTRQMLEEFQDKIVFLGVDRLDYTKGIPERLQAYQIFLRQNPAYIGKVVFVQVCVPSRSDIKAYGNLRSQVERLIGEIAGEFGAPGYAPIQYIYRNLPVEEVVSLYRRADVMIVTPLRDGLNLVCKEYVAVQNENAGTLILSEFAGAASEMGEAFIVNPYDVQEVAATMHDALQLDPAVREERMARLRERVLKFDNIAWSKEFMRQWQAFTKSSSTAVEMAGEIRRKFLDDVKKARKVFVCCDYDGTLVPIYPQPEQAIPDDKVHQLIKDLTCVEGLELAIVTGRQRQFCETYFAEDDIHIACEHGLYARFAKSKTDWYQHQVADEFERLKPEILGLLNLYTRSLPGARIEEKECSVVWHYRNVKGGFADGQALSLKEELKQLLAGTTFAAFSGKKVVDIRPVLANKGHAIDYLLENRQFDATKDVLVCLGDDTTDEDMFQAQRPHNHSINVGGLNIFSRYFLNTQSDVAPFLQDLIAARSGR